MPSRAMMRSRQPPMLSSRIRISAATATHASKKSLRMLGDFMIIGEVTSFNGSVRTAPSRFRCTKKPDLSIAYSSSIMRSRRSKRSVVYHSTPAPLKSLSFDHKGTFSVSASARIGMSSGSRSPIRRVASSISAA